MPEPCSTMFRRRVPVFALQEVGGLCKNSNTKTPKIRGGGGRDHAVGYLANHSPEARTSSSLDGVGTGLARSVPSISILFNYCKESQSESRDLANSPQRIPKAPAPRTPFFRALVVNRHSEFSFRFVFKSPKSKTKSQHVWSQNDYI